MRSLPTPRLSALLCFAGACALAPALTGCEALALVLVSDSQSGPPADGPYAPEGVAHDGVALQTKNAQASGSLGQALDFSGSAYQTDAYDNGESTNITLWVNSDPSVPESKRWAAMASVTIGNGGLGSDVFEPGAELHFSSTDTSSAPFVYSYGCSGIGLDAEALDYELGADDTDIEVTEAKDPGMVHLAITMTYPFGSSTQVMRGELDVATPQ